MDVSVFGLGYVGLVTAACLAKDGHKIIGCDISQSKVNLLNNKKSPIVEDQLQDLIISGVESGHLHATTDYMEAASCSETVLICVGTPSNRNGSLNTKYVEQVTSDIAESLIGRSNHLTIIYRSTMLPGTIDEILIPILEEKCGRSCGDGYSVVFNPEFLRETTAIGDYYNPPKTVIGCYESKDAERILSLYSHLPGPKITTSINVAEMVKYVDNCWHATKITFANEVGSICKGLDINSHDVMDIFIQDKKLNISEYYLKPGFAYGGSCLPKDLRALSYLSKMLDVNVPLLNSSAVSNDSQIDYVFKNIEDLRCSKILLYGLAFKAGTDDLRESPYVILAEKLVGRGYEVAIFDESLIISDLVGSNLEYSNTLMPHLKNFMVADLNSAICDSELVILCHKMEVSEEINFDLLSEKVVFDLAKIDENISKKLNHYQGVSW